MYIHHMSSSMIRKQFYLTPELDERLSVNTEIAIVNAEIGPRERSQEAGPTSVRIKAASPSARSSATSTICAP